MENLKWYTIPKYPTYEINERLEIRHKVKLKIRKCYLDDDGYLALSLTYNGKNVNKRLHQLVGYVFVPNPENKPELHHIDEDKLNNHWSNLMWVTKKEHRQISKENEQTAHKLSVKDVLYVREVYTWDSRFKLANQFDVSVNTIYYIATGSARKDVGGTIHPLLGIHKKIINTATGEIIESSTVLAKILGIKRKEIHRRLNGERYNDTPYRYVGMEHVIKERPVVEKEKTPIALFDIQWNFIRRYEYKSDLCAFLKVDGSRVNEFLRGKCSFIKRYKLKEIDEDGNFIEPVEFVSKKPPLKPKKIRKPVVPSKSIIKYSLDGVELERFESLGSAARSIKADKSNFRSQVKKSPTGFHKGFIWKYA